MLYKRSSFIRLLQTKYDCEVKPINDRVLVIKNGVMSSRMWMDGKDRIDYEEIYLHYQKLLLPDLPGDSELERIE